MIAEVLMHRMGWGDAWYAHPGPVGLRRFLRYALPGRWHVGVFTGPQHDLICVKHCTTNEEAERYLSPAGPTVLLACLAARWKVWRLGVSRAREVAP